MGYSVETLKSLRRDAIYCKRNFEKRKNGIQQAYNNAYRLNDYFTGIKSSVDSCTFRLSNGIKGIASAVDNKCSAISSRRENQCLTNQYQFSAALAYMTKEMRRCQNNIDYYNNEIANYEWQIKEQGGVILPWE